MKVKRKYVNEAFKDLIEGCTKEREESKALPNAQCSMTIDH